MRRYRIRALWRLPRGILRRRRFSLAILLVLVLLLLFRELELRRPWQALPPVTGKEQGQLNIRTCTKVIDGDTIICDGVGKIRLIGIDCPELDEEAGHKAAEFVREQVSGKKVKIEKCPVNPLDKYRRLRAIIYFKKDGEWINLNEFLVEEGYAAVSYLAPCHVDSRQWLPLEEAAQKEGKGIWGDKLLSTDFSNKPTHDKPE